MTAWKANPWIPALGSLLLCVAVVPAGTLGAQEKDLSGEWVIDPDESDEPAEVLEALTRRSSGGSGVGIGIGIFGIPVGEVARTGEGGSEPEEVVRRDLRKLRRHLINAVDELDIEQSPDTLRVDYDDLGTSIYRTGETLEGGEETSLAEWRRDVYTVERHMADELQATEELYLDRRDPNRLHWKVSIELSSGKAVQIDRVYDRAPQP
jgi:hypothetical protein